MVRVSQWEPQAKRTVCKCAVHGACSPYGQWHGPINSIMYMHGLLVALRCGKASEAATQVSSTFSFSDCAGNLTNMLVRPTPTPSRRGLCLGEHNAVLRQELYNCGLRGNTLFCCACGSTRLDCMCSVGSVDTAAPSRKSGKPQGCAVVCRLLQSFAVTVILHDLFDTAAHCGLLSACCTSVLDVVMLRLSPANGFKLNATLEQAVAHAATDLNACCSTNMYISYVLEAAQAWAANEKLHNKMKLITQL